MLGTAALQLLNCRKQKRWQVILTVLIACVVVGYLQFVDRASRKTYQAYVALNGTGPLVDR